MTKKVIDQIKRIELLKDNFALDLERFGSMRCLYCKHIANPDRTGLNTVEAITTPATIKCKVGHLSQYRTYQPTPLNGEKWTMFDFWTFPPTTICPDWEGTDTDRGR